MNMNIQKFLERFESNRDGEKLQHVLLVHLKAFKKQNKRYTP